MKQKIIFIDVDGTLMSELGHIPKSAKDALHKAKENGHLIYLSTGRTLVGVTDEMKKIDFDGMVGGGGAFIQIGNEVVLQQKIDNAKVPAVINYFEENDIDFFIESSESYYAKDGYIEKMVAEISEQYEEGSDAYNARKKHSDEFFGRFELLDLLDVDNDEVVKFCFRSKTIDYQTIYDVFVDDFAIVPYTLELGVNGGEMGLKDVNKATAIEILLEKLNMDKSQTIAFGDGHNDIEMFELVDVSFAMDNAVDALKEVATHVTSRPEHDGIEKGLKKIGLI